jgi:hypothetical protein
MSAEVRSHETHSSNGLNPIVPEIPTRNFWISKRLAQRCNSGFVRQAVVQAVKIGQHYFPNALFEWLATINFCPRAVHHTKVLN